MDSWAEKQYEWADQKGPNLEGVFYMLRALYHQQKEMAEFYEQERRLGETSRDSAPTPRPSESKTLPEDPSGVASPNPDDGLGTNTCANCGRKIEKPFGFHSWVHKSSTLISCYEARQPRPAQQMAEPAGLVMPGDTTAKCINCSTELHIMVGSHKIFWVHANGLVPCLPIAG